MTRPRGPKGSTRRITAHDDGEHRQLSLFDAAVVAPDPVAPPGVVDTDTLLAALRSWADAGWIRRLDAAMARFAASLSPDAAPCALLAIAMTAHVEGRGHTCLPLGDLSTDPRDGLGWPPEAAAAWARLMAGLPTHVDDWRIALSASDAVDADSGVIEPTAPFVLRGDRLYLRRYWTYEQQVARAVRQRTTPRPDVVDEAAVRRWLDHLFPDDGHAPDWQKIACAIALRGRLSIITGGPGTGKTFTAARLLALWFATSADPENLRVSLAAPTGKAAARLKQSIEGALQGLESQLAASGHPLPLVSLASHMAPARTLHSLLGARPDTRHWRRHAAHPLDVDVLLIDEASMVHLEMMAAVLDALPPTARVVLLGDKDQLASVEAGAVLGDLCRDADRGRFDDHTARYVEAVTGRPLPESLRDADGPPLAQHTVMLRRSQRFGGAIGELALAVNAGDADAAWRVLSESTDPAVHWLATGSASAVVDLAVQGRPGAEGSYRAYLEAIRARPTDPDEALQHAWVKRVLAAFDRCRVLCAVRAGDWGVDGINRAIEKRFADEQWMAPRGDWYEGRPVMVTRNDAALGIFNGDIGITLRASPDDAALRVHFAEAESVRSISIARLADVDTAFALTVHQSQGSEFEHAVLVLPPHAHGIARELIYTGITRARSGLTLVAGHRDTFTDAIARTTRRASGLMAAVADGRGVADDKAGG